MREGDVPVILELGRRNKEARIAVNIVRGSATFALAAAETEESVV